MEKEKLIDLLFAENERIMAEIARLKVEKERLAGEIQKAQERTARFKERALAAEKRVEVAEKRIEEADSKFDPDIAIMQKEADRLTSLVERIRNGEELKALLARAEKAEKKAADLSSASSSNL